MNRLLNALGAAAAFTWATTAAGQGLYWETTTTGAGREPATAKAYVMPKMMKIVRPNGQVTILRADQKEVISLDTTKRTYREHSVSPSQRGAKTTTAPMESALAQLQQRTKQLAPEQRAKMERIIGQMRNAALPKAASVTVEATGETKTIGGHLCRKYVAMENGRTVLVAWTTKDIKGFEALHDDWVALQQQLGSANPSRGAAMTNAYAKIEGFPMLVEAGNVKTVVTKVDSRNTPTSEFTVPAGYKKERVTKQ
jgi:hypothetical protein